MGVSVFLLKLRRELHRAIMPDLLEIVSLSRQIDLIINGYVYKKMELICN